MFLHVRDVLTTKASLFLINYTCRRVEYTHSYLNIITTGFVVSHIPDRRLNCAINLTLHVVDRINRWFLRASGINVDANVLGGYAD